MAKSSASEPVTVRIGGEDHTIRANVKPEYTRRCAKLVDDRISEVRGQLGLIESHKAAILAALSITDELFQARSEADDLKGLVATRTTALADRLEDVLAEPVDMPPAVDPPAVDPPAVEPPVVDPPAVDPPAVDPPAVEEVPPVPEDAQLAFGEPGDEGVETDGVGGEQQPGD